MISAASVSSSKWLDVSLIHEAHRCFLETHTCHEIDIYESCVSINDVVKG